MTCRPVRFLTCALIAAAVWLACRNAATTAQNPPPATDIEKRLQALEDKLDKLTQLLAAREQPRPAEGGTAKILTDAAERLRVELSAKEKQLADSRAQGGGFHVVHLDDAVRRNSERLSKIETKRAEYRLEKAELEEQLRQIEKAYKEGGKAAAMDKIAAFNVKSRVVDAVGRYEEEVLKLQLMKKKASATYSPNHPILKELDEQIELLRQMAGKDFKDGKDDDTPTKVMKALKERTSGLEMMLRTIDNMFEQDQRHARELAKIADEEKRMVADIDRARRALVAVQAAMLELDKPAK